MDVKIEWNLSNRDMYEAKNFVRGVKKSHSLSNLRDWTWWHLYTYASTLWRPPSIRLCLNSKR